MNLRQWAIALCAGSVVSFALGATPADAKSERAVYVAIGKVASANAYTLLASGNSATTRIIFCTTGDPATCRDGGPSSYKTTYATVINKRRIFMTARPVTLAGGMMVTFVALGSEGAKLGHQVVRIDSESGPTPPGPGNPGNGSGIKIENLVLNLPSGWKLHQDAMTGGVLFLGFKNGEDYLRIYVQRQSGLDMKGIFTNGSRVTQEIAPQTYGNRSWNILKTSKDKYYVTAFMLEEGGVTYYGYCRAVQADRASKAVDTFLGSIR